MALDGRRAESAAAYRTLVGEWRDARLPLDLGVTLLLRAWLLGPGDPEAADGRSEAIAIFDAMGALGLADRIETAAVRRSPQPAVKAGG